MEANKLSPEQLQRNRLVGFEPLSAKLGIPAAELASLPPEAIAELGRRVRVRRAREYYRLNPKAPKSSSAAKAETTPKPPRQLLTADEKALHRAVIQSRYQAAHQKTYATNNRVWCAANRERINAQRRARRAAARLQSADAQRGGLKKTPKHAHVCGSADV
jgi:hypothetical protein